MFHLFLNKWWLLIGRQVPDHYRYQFLYCFHIGTMNSPMRSKDIISIQTHLQWRSAKCLQLSLQSLILYIHIETVNPPRKPSELISVPLGTSDLAPNASHWCWPLIGWEVSDHYLLHFLFCFHIGTALAYNHPPVIFCQVLHCTCGLPVMSICIWAWNIGPVTFDLEGMTLTLAFYFRWWWIHPSQRPCWFGLFSSPALRTVKLIILNCKPAAWCTAQCMLSIWNGAPKTSDSTRYLKQIYSYQFESWNIAFLRAPKDARLFWIDWLGLGLAFQGHCGHKVQIWFSEDNSKGFRAVNLKFGTDICLGSGQMPIVCGVAILNRVDHWVTKGQCHVAASVLTGC